MLNSRVGGPFSLVLGCVLACASLAQGAGEAPSERTAILTLGQAFEEAARSNVGLVATRLETEVAEAGDAVARQRPNPELALESVRETPRDAAMLSQTLEIGGKRRHRVDLSSAIVATRQAEVVRAGVELHARVRRAFFALRAAERRLSETEALQRLAERTRGVARARFETGDVPRLDVVQAELAAAQAESEALMSSGRLVQAQASLNGLLGRPAQEATRTTPSDVDSAPQSDDWESGQPPSPVVAVEIALRESSELAVLDRALDEQRARVALVRSEQIPDLVAQGGVTHRARPDFDWGWRFGLTIPLPIFTFRGAAVEVEQRTLTALEAQRRARAQEVTAAVLAAASAAAVERQQLQRYREQILPRADEVERMAEDAYRSGQTSLQALLQALQATRDVRLRAIQAGADYQSAQADLESAMGVEVP